MSHLAVIAGFVPQPESREAVARILRGMVTPTRAESGCLQYDLYETERGFHLFERYVDTEAITAHQNTSHYQAYKEAIADHLAEAISVDVGTPVDVE